ncbi:MAG: ABC transporter ATP-binding protein [Saccharothrix sp.]|nr:ABC transporter ATP-binding protein [Saccharothrix sp.]
MARGTLPNGWASRQFEIIRPHLRVAVSFYATAVVAAVVPILQVLVLRGFVDSLGSGGEPRLFALLLGVFCAVFLLGALMRFASATLSAMLAYRIIAALQRRMFERLTSMPLAFYTSVRPGAVVSRMTNDVNGIEAMYTEVLPAIVSSTVAISVSVVLIAAVEPSILLLVLVVPVFLVVVRRSESRINELINTSFDITRRIANSTESLVGKDGILLARQNGRTDDERRKFFELTHESSTTSRRIATSAATANASYNTAFGLMTAVALGVSVWLALQGRLTIGDVVMTALFVQQLQAPVQTLLGTRYPRLRARIAFERVFEVLDSKVPPDRKSLVRQRVAADLAPPASDVKLAMRGVSFTYPPVSAYSIDGLSQMGDAISIPWLPMTGFTAAAADAPADRGRQVLVDFDLEIRAGQVKAIVGSSGSGKSTVALLAAGMLEPTSGVVEVAGRDIADMSHAELASRVAFISQDTFVLHDSIRANLKYAKPDASDQEIIDACAAARLLAFVEGHDDGLDAVVGEKGHRLSGGERQRVAIARALLKDPELVILDEATAHLDRRTEAEVMDEVLAAFSTKALLVIAHRLRTVTRADEILVLEDGIVVQRGHHTDLVEDHAGPYVRLSRTAE